MAAAQAADVVVLVVGESADMSGEARSRAQLGLPGRQQELVDAVAATGTPIVVVLLSGRPLVIPGLAEQAGALLVAWHGGIRAGRAVADILFGAATLPASSPPAGRAPRAKFRSTTPTKTPADRGKARAPPSSASRSNPATSMRRTTRCSRSATA